VGNRQGHAETERLLQHLVIPQRFAVGMQEKMRMAFNEPRNERRARQLHAFYFRRRFHLRRAAHRINPVSLDEDDNATLRCILDTVPHRLRDQKNRVLSFGRLRRRLDKRRGQCEE
jgi:hypothetical protein